MKVPTYVSNKRGRAIAVAGVLCVSVITASPAQACTCIFSATIGAATISGLMGAGSAAVVTSMTTGFQSVGSQVTASSAANEKKIIKALDSMTKRLGTEIRQMPLNEAKMETLINQASPTRRATDECRYGDRSGDLATVERLTALQQENLASSTYAYNEMTSDYPEGIDTGRRFMAQTARLIRNAPDIKTAPMVLVNGPNTFGALTPEQTQNAFTALNLTLNPNPPARSINPTSPVALKNDVKADLYNLRMTIPQTVSQQILSYEAPVLQSGSDSWVAETLSRISPNAADAFTAGEVDVSKSDLLRLMATYRTKDPVWVGNVSAKDDEGVMKDLALVKMDHLSMEYELWVQDRHMALLTSQLLASKLRQERD
jgi:hypothetical protein